MLLETLDLRSKDILIYSQNMFNFNDNFKIIHKNQKVKRAERVTYFDVCNYVKDPSPKNLVVYRMLTNVNTLDAYSTKYGYFIKLNGKVELIYFDPVFAIKDLRHLRFDFDPSKFRFKIQQLGLTSLTKREDEPNFAEVYSFDLKADEAQNQNDKIFADAIFAFDPDFIDDEEISTAAPKEQPEPKEFRINNSKALNTQLKNISEDRSDIKSNLNALRSVDPAKVSDLREEIIDLLKQALGIPGEKAPQNPEPVKPEIKAPEKKQEHKDDLNLFDLFKSTQKTNDLSIREKESVILKFDV